MDLTTLEKIEKVGSKLEKQRLLSTLKDDVSTIRFLKFALDPMITFGVTVDQDKELAVRNSPGFAQLDHRRYWITVKQLCERLSCRELTGNAAAEAVTWTISYAPTDTDAIWTCRILNKDLRSGFSISTLNKALPGTLEPFACSLAKPYEPDKHEIRGDWCVEPKLDGLRMVVKDGIAYTRNGRTIDSVGHILEELKPFGNFVFDGEIMGVVNFDEDSGKIRKKGEGPNLSLKYNIFDVIRRDQWNDKKTTLTRDRKMILSAMFNPELTHEAAGFKYIHCVPHTVLVDPTTEKLFETRDMYIKMGYEGAMLKDLNSPYIFKRSDSVLKLKDFKDADGRIVDTFEGRGKHKGRLGGVIAEFEGVLTRVGSGFTDAQRDDLWKRKSEIIGKMIEVQYQNKTVDGTLRFPVMVRFRPDKD